MSMKQLWAPWRMEFLTGPRKPDAECVFCALPKETNDKDNLIVHRGKKTFVILNKFPYNNGHVMVVPNAHSADLAGLPADVAEELFRTTQTCVKVLTSVYKPEGFNLGMNLGQAGGAGIREHLHMHIVPRWLGDTNFMPVIGETKAMPQHLATSFDQIYDQFRRI